MFATALVTGCGGGHDAKGSSAISDVSEEQPVSTPQPAAFSCPAGYKKFEVADSTVPNADVSLVTDDGIATFTFRTPENGRTDVVLCLGKPDPIPAGVQADYVYELKGSPTRLSNRRLVLNFTTDAMPTRIPPTIELAKVSDGVVTYLPVIEGPIYAVRPNYSLTANPNEPGLYVVRMTQ